MKIQLSSLLFACLLIVQVIVVVDNAKSKKSIGKKANKVKGAKPSGTNKARNSDKSIDKSKEMKKLTISPSNCGKSRLSSDTLIDGEQTPLGTFPWIVHIYFLNLTHCAGTIINDQWILTSANCVSMWKDPKTVVRVGSDSREDGEEYELSKIIINPEFVEVQVKEDNPVYGSADIALLKTKKKIKLIDKVQAVCLPTQSNSEPKNKNLIIPGALIKNQELVKKESTEMTASLLSLISHEECVEKLSGNKENVTIDKSCICTWSEGKKECKGDSGGPLMETISGKTYIVGIILGTFTCEEKYPELFTKVSSFLPWIKETIDENK